MSISLIEIEGPGTQVRLRLVGDQVLAMVPPARRRLLEAMLADAETQGLAVLSQSGSAGVCATYANQSIAPARRPGLERTLAEMGGR